MRVFVTGASGFVGRHVISALQGRGHEVRALLLPRESPIDGVEVVYGDITDPSSLRGLLDGQDAVVHLAGAVGYGQKLATCVALNVEGTKHVAHAALAAGAHRFIHMSSVSVYGRVPEVDLTEDAPMRVTGEPYGDTKIHAERVVRALSSQSGLHLTIVRPTVIYGPGDDKFLPKVIENLESGQARIIGRGDNTVDLVHVRDVAGFVAMALEDERTIGEVYNLNDPENPTWSAFLATVAQELGRSPPKRRLPYAVALGVAGSMELVAAVTKRPPRLTRYAVRVVGRQYRYRTERAQSVGFRPSVPLQQGIAEHLGRN